MVEIQLLLDLHSDCGSENTECHSSYCVKIHFFFPYFSLPRALADILRQQGPIPIAHCERETISAIDTSPKENTPVRTSSKNHYTPVRTAKSNPGKCCFPARSLQRWLYRCCVRSQQNITLDKSGFCKPKMALKGNQMEQRSARISGDDSLRFLLNRVAVLSWHFKNSESVRYKFSLYQNACIKLRTLCVSNKTHML